MEEKKLLRPNPISNLALAAMIVGIAGIGLDALSTIYAVSSPWDYLRNHTFWGFVNVLNSIALWGALAVFAFGMAGSALKTLVGESILKTMFILACVTGGLSFLMSFMPVQGSYMFSIFRAMAAIGYGVMQLLVYIKIAKVAELRTLAVMTLVFFITLMVQFTFGFVPVLNIMTSLAFAAGTVLYLLQCKKEM